MTVRLSRRTFTGSALALAAVTGSPFALTSAAQAESHAGNPLITPRIMGNTDAKVHIIEYSSMTCPHCANFHANALPQIKAQYIDTGKASFEIRDYPLNEPAAIGTLLARCAPEDRYFPLVDMLFSQMQSWRSSPDIITELARLGGFAGMSKPDLDACFQNQELYSAIYEQRGVWQELHNIRATPTVFVNETRLEGARDFQEYADAIEAEL